MIIRIFSIAVTVMCLVATAHAGTLTILHTNDLHSRVEPINRFNDRCSVEENEAGECFGGYARLATAIREVRSAVSDVLLLDGGDQFQGSLFYTWYKGKVAAEMMNVLGYDAMTVGNHEFDDGPEVLREFMDEVQFPVLLSNADVSLEPLLSNVLMPSTVIERGGHRYGLIGLTPENTPEIASPGGRVRFTDPLEAVQREIYRLEDQGVDRIIVLSHSGFRIDKHIASLVEGIDVIVGGHTNTLLSNTSAKADGPYPTWVEGPFGGRTALVYAYAYGKFLGRLDVVFDEKGVVISATGEPISMDSTIPEDRAIKSRIAELAIPLASVLKKVVGEAKLPIDGSHINCRSRECEAGNLVADAILARLEPSGVEIVITNGGGIQDSIDQGPITMGEVLDVLPFKNLISTFSLSGEDIVASLENGVSRVERGQGRFPQVAGLRYAYDLSKEPNEGRIESVEVLQGGQWMPIDHARTYRLATNDFLRGGGDGYRIFSDNATDVYDFGPDVADTVVKYLENHGPYTPRLDGRIRMK